MQKKQSSHAVINELVNSLPSLIRPTLLFSLHRAFLWERDQAPGAARATSLS